MPSSHQNKLLLILRSKLLIGSGLLILAFISYATIRDTIQRQGVDEEISSLKEEIETLESQNVELSKLIGQFRTDSFVEEEARVKMGLAKPGEKVVVISRDQPGETVTLNSENSSEEDGIDLSQPINILGEKVGNPKKWWHYFFGPRR